MSEITIDGIVYATREEGDGAFVKGKGDGAPPQNFVIPSTVEIGGASLPVVAIARLAFSEGPFTSAVIPRSVKDVGGAAFQKNKDLN
jgi:hypothetical protein